MRTRSVRLMLILSLAFLVLTLKAEERTIAFYIVKPVTDPPKLDGKLDDACWQQASRAGNYYVYLKTSPVMPKIKTAFSMLYDSKGLYLGIYNYDDNLDNIRQTMTDRDNPRLWQDDCAEIYIDPEAKGIGYIKFVVNPLGTQHDLKKVDSAIMLPNWSGNNWVAKTSKTKDSWDIEIFIPWEDLSKKAVAGSVWRFDHTRYAYSTGRFQGVTWSLGGYYGAPDKFGYLYFSSPASLDKQQVANVLSKEIAAPWLTLFGNEFLQCTAKGDYTFFPSGKLVENDLRKLRESVTNTDVIIRSLPKPDPKDRKKANLNTLFDSYQKFSSQYKEFKPETATPLTALITVQKLKSLSQQASDVYWQAKFLKLIDFVNRPETAETK